MTDAALHFWFQVNNANLQGAEAMHRGQIRKTFQVPLHITHKLGLAVRVSVVRHAECFLGEKQRAAFEESQMQQMGRPKSY